mgnify:CR=1 FL=1
MSLAETMARRFSAAKAGGCTGLRQGLGKRRADHGGVGGALAQEPLNLV